MAVYQHYFRQIVCPSHSVKADEVLESRNKNKALSPRVSTCRLKAFFLADCGVAAGLNGVKEARDGRLPLFVGVLLAEGVRPVVLSGLFGDLATATTRWRIEALAARRRKQSVNTCQLTAYGNFLRRNQLGRSCGEVCLDFRCGRNRWFKSGRRFDWRFP